MFEVGGGASRATTDVAGLAASLHRMVTRGGLSRADLIDQVRALEE